VSQTGHIEPRLTHRSSLLSSLGDHLSEENTDEIVRAQERKQNFLASCTLKALSPIVEIVAHERLRGMSDSQGKELARELLMFCRQQSASVCSTLELSDDSVAWGRSYYAGAIADQIAKAWPAARRKTLDIDWSSALCEIAKPMLLSGLPPSWKNTELSVSISATTMTAMQSLMQRYEVFSMFHRDKETIQERFSSLLISEALRQVEFVVQSYPLSEESRCSLAQSLIKNGGSILASLWEAHGRSCVNVYQNSATPFDKENYRRNGFPLEDLECSFIDQMEVFGRLTLKSMNEVQYGAHQPSNQSMGTS